jgi:hypothetical protein
MKNKINLNQTVFTTKYVVFEKSSIVYVYHDEDDDWQFFGKEECETSDAAIVSLEEMIDIDPSINNILHLPKGSEAFRTNLEEEWIIVNKS